MNSCKRFQIFSVDGLIGYSDLEFGDPPMGVAFGEFDPTEDYRAFRKGAKPLEADGYRIWGGLVARTPNGEVLECVGGTVVHEFGAIEKYDELFVFCLGIDSEKYNELFPGRWEEYEDSFK